MHMCMIVGGIFCGADFVKISAENRVSRISAYSADDVKIIYIIQ